jgi:hypothetical protein
VVFLDIKDKVWRIKDKEYKVIEDIPMKDLKWFKDKYKEIIKKNEEKKLTQTEALEFDDLWWTKLCEVGLGTTIDDVLDSNCTEKQFRDFMAELYNFLSNVSTIEEAKQLDLYDQKTKAK